MFPTEPIEVTTEMEDAGREVFFRLLHEVYGPKFGHPIPAEGARIVRETFLAMMAKRQLPSAQEIHERNSRRYGWLLPAAGVAFTIIVAVALILASPFLVIIAAFKTAQGAALDIIAGKFRWRRQ